MDNKKNSWGGARANSGPKRKTEDRLDIKLYMRVSEKEQLLIKEKAEQKSFFRFNILFGIGLVVLMGIVALWILRSNEG